MCACYRQRGIVAFKQVTISVLASTSDRLMEKTRAGIADNAGLQRVGRRRDCAGFCGSVSFVSFWRGMEGVAGVEAVCVCAESGGFQRVYAPCGGNGCVCFGGKFGVCVVDVE